MLLILFETTCQIVISANKIINNYLAAYISDPLDSAGEQTEIYSVQIHMLYKENIHLYI